MGASAVWRVTNALGVTFLGTVIILAAPRPADAQALNLSEALRGVGEYVERYFSRVQNIVGVETVTVQPLAHDFSSEGRARMLVYELRLDWSSGTAGDIVPTVTRELVRVDGRVPRPKDEPQCLDPREATPEPLEFLLPGRQERFVFTTAGTSVIGGRRAQMIDYRGRAPEPVDVTWKENCATVDLPGRMRGRVWVDAQDATVLRLDEFMIGQVDLRVPAEQQRRGGARSMTLERADTTIRYRPVRFDDPEETIFLPESIEALTVIRDAGVPRLRVRHRFSNYRRFVTGGRIVQ